LTIEIIFEKCTGCAKCVQVCPFGVIGFKEKKAVVREGCTLCGACYEVCEFGAIVFEPPSMKIDYETAQYNGVFVFAEQREGELKSCVFELLGEGRKLADKLGDELAAVLIGHDIHHLCPVLFAHGADKVYLASDIILKHYLNETYTPILSAAINQYKPSIFLFGATTTGRDLAPRVASRVKTGLTADCTGLDVDEASGNLLQTRPAFGGNIMATIKTPNHRPQMATVRPRVMKPALSDEVRKGQIIDIPLAMKPKGLRTEFLGFEAFGEQDVSLEEAEIVVSGGRGIQNQENIRLLKELANALGGSVGASRPLVDKGWFSHSCQIGQTGKTVCPKIYIACGISGAIQHLVGMASSDKIIAINKDPLAPIMEVADYAVTGDLFQILPKLIEKIKNNEGVIKHI
jgi:electron transfer flavoprotein alpha subunit